MLGWLILEREGSDRPVGSILLRTGFKEAKDGRFEGPEGVNWSALCWRATVEGGPEEKGADVEVWGGGRGVVVPELSLSRITLAVARSAEVGGLRGNWMLA